MEIEITFSDLSYNEEKDRRANLYLGFEVTELELAKFAKLFEWLDNGYTITNMDIRRSIFRSPYPDFSTKTSFPTYEGDFKP